MHEATLGLLQLNAMLLQPDKHYLEIVQVVRGTGDLDVVKVANYIGQTKEALIHGLLKNGRRMHKPHRPAVQCTGITLNMYLW